MTPLEVFAYKQSWKPGYTVRLHSDVVNQAKTWCRRNLGRHEWSMTEWTGVYEHTFHFEKEEMADNFKDEMGRFADQ